MAILKRAEKAMIRAMCEVKLIEKRNCQELVSWLGSEETLNRPAKANGIRQHGHVFRRESDDVLRRAFGFEVTRRTRNDVEKAGGCKRRQCKRLD